jgi:hypothetical protein
VSEQAAVDEGEQPEDVPAAAAGQEAQALAGAVLTPADADMVQRAEAEAVDGETPAPDEAGDFVKCVEGRASAGRDTEDADAVKGRRADEAD